MPHQCSPVQPHLGSRRSPWLAYWMLCFCRSVRPYMRALPQTTFTGTATQMNLCQPDMLSLWEPSPRQASPDSTCWSTTLCCVGTAGHLLTGLRARKSAGGVGRYRPGLLAWPVFTYVIMVFMYHLYPCYSHIHCFKDANAQVYCCRYAAIAGHADACAMQGYEAAREGQRFMTKDHAKFVFKLRDSDLQVCLSAHGLLPA